MFYFNAVIKYHGVLYVLSTKASLTSRRTEGLFGERSTKGVQNSIESGRTAHIFNWNLDYALLADSLLNQ
jgi:hypothetical protein